MADICMCQDTECPSRRTCYRYTAPPTWERQAVFAESPRDPQVAECDHYWLSKPVKRRSLAIIDQRNKRNPT